MKDMLKRFIKKTPLYSPLRKWLLKTRQVRLVREWENDGHPVPPPHIIKQRVLKAYAEEYDLRVLVETGTYYGEMVEAMKHSFDRIYSIELSHELFEIARERFKSAVHIAVIHGDSGKALARVLENIKQPALFWLDGHYSGGVTARGEKETPIYEELSHILNSQERRHVIIIDDARCFGIDPAYPTIEQLKEFISSKRDDVQVTVKDDSIRVVPKS